MKFTAKILSVIVMLAVFATLLVVPTAAAEPTTVAHWRFQNVDGYYVGSAEDDSLHFVDLSGHGNDLQTVVAGNGDQLDIFSWDDGCDMPSVRSASALKFDNTKAKAATVDPYNADETSYTGGYTSGKYLETIDGAPKIGRAHV